MRIRNHGRDISDARQTQHHQAIGRAAGTRASPEQVLTRQPGPDCSPEGRQSCVHDQRPIRGLMESPGPLLRRNPADHGLVRKISIDREFCDRREPSRRTTAMDGSPGTWCWEQGPTSSVRPYPAHTKSSGRRHLDWLGASAFPRAGPQLLRLRERHTRERKPPPRYSRHPVHKQTPDPSRGRDQPQTTTQTEWTST